MSRPPRRPADVVLSSTPRRPPGKEEPHPRGQDGALLHPRAGAEPADPDPGAVAGTTKYLREDATWAAPATGSANIKETEVDFGNVVSRTEQTFTITDADVSAGSQLLAQILHKAPSDARSVDEIQCEQFDILCAPAAGTFDMTMRGRSGSVMGKFIVAYLVG